MKDMSKGFCQPVIRAKSSGYGSKPQNPGRILKKRQNAAVSAETARIVRIMEAVNPVFFRTFPHKKSVFRANPKPAPVIKIGTAMNGKGSDFIFLRVFEIQSVIGDNPQPLLRVFVQTGNFCQGKRGRVSGQRPYAGIKKVQTFIGSDPYFPFRSIVHAPDIHFFSKTFKFLSVFMKTAESAVPGSGPYSSFGIRMQTVNRITAQAACFVRVMPEMNKGFRKRIKTVQASVLGSDPEISFGIFQQTAHSVVTQSAGITGNMLIYFETVSVKTVQSLLCSNPEKPLLILQNAENRDLGQSLCNRIGAEYILS